MDWKIVKGREEQVKEIAALYARTIDALVEGVNYTGWQRGGYPGEGTAREGVAAGTLYVAQKEGVIGGTVILNHLYEGAYEKGEWAVDCPYSEVFCVHTLVVDPACRGQGIASALLDFAAAEGLRSGMRALRLDVFEENAPAIALYEKKGFERRTRVDLGLGIPGLKWFYLCEKLL